MIKQAMKTSLAASVLLLGLAALAQALAGVDCKLILLDRIV